jgi:outer membrane protein TolC
MKTITAVILFISLFSISFTKSVSAEISKSKPLLTLTLRKAVQLALKRNPGIKGLENSLKINQEKIGIAKSFLLPKIFVQEAGIGTNDPAYAFSLKLEQRRFSLSDLLGAPGTFNNPSPVSDFRTSLFLEEPIYMPTAKTEVKTADLMYQAQKENFYLDQQKLAFQVIQTWLMIKTARDYVKTADKGVHDAEAHLKLAQKLYQSGIGLYSDTLRAFTAVKQAEQKFIQASTRYQVSKLFLGYLLGINHPVQILIGRKGKSVFFHRHLKFYIHQWKKRDDLKSLLIQLSAAKKRIHLAQESYSPTLSFEGSYNLHDYRYPFGIEANDWEVMLEANLNLFEGRRRREKLRIAREQQKELQEQYIQFQNAVQLKVKKAYLEVKEAQKNVTLAEAAVKSSEEGVRLVQLRYQNSLSPFLDLLDAQVSLDHSRSLLVSAKNQYLTALYRFFYQTGNLLKIITLKAATKGDDPEGEKKNGP